MDANAIVAHQLVADAEHHDGRAGLIVVGRLRQS
jgi:hypothetical protein